MSMFSICTSFVAEGALDEPVASLAAAEAKFTREIGELCLEEYLLAGLRDPMGMSRRAACKQFPCAPLRLAA